MILNKKDTVEFLHSRSLRPSKGSMNTIAKMIEVGKEVGYQITKVGIDQFEILPNYFIKDYNKRVIIYKDLPSDIKMDCVVDGKPWGRVTDDCFDGWTMGAFRAICYLYKLKDGEFLDNTQFDDYEMALAQFLGYVKEDKDFIYIYYYPRKIDLGYYDWEGKLSEWKR